MLNHRVVFPAQFLVLLAVLLSATPAFSSVITLSKNERASACIQGLADRSHPIFGELNAPMLEALQRHPIAKRYKVDKEGAELYFQFPLLCVGRNLREEVIATETKGECIQSHFVAATLKNLFPRATLYEDASRTKKPIRLFVGDIAESGFPGGDQGIFASYLDMTVLKKANGRTLGLDRKEARERLSLPQNAWVIHRYASGMANALPDPIEHLLSRFTDRPLVVIESMASYGGGGNTYQSLRLPIPTMDLSGYLELGKAKKKESHYIYNNLSGVIPWISKAADLVIVAGPINPFEGLNAGTPTLIRDYDFKELSFYNYDPRSFAGMKALAVATGGARVFKNTSEFQAGIESFLNGDLKNIQAPYLLPINGKSAFDTYLDELVRVLDSHLPH